MCSVIGNKCILRVANLVVIGGLGGKPLSGAGGADDSKVQGGSAVQGRKGRTWPGLYSKILKSVLAQALPLQLSHQHSHEARLKMQLDTVGLRLASICTLGEV